ncbi:MAG TPA: hypothetical protein VEK15_19115, partial [Vicinamibacteria bacterium]|nr:hypothetical protein [Vicinamibacteria bacterium]
MTNTQQRTQTLEVARREDRPVECLAALRALLDALDREGIRYCHWKSNEHLEAALQGKTDLDILVDRRSSLALRRVLGETSFKRFCLIPQRAYPAMEDYLGMDEETGSLIHVHLHHRLTMGERHLKGYRLPWEELVLSTRQIEPKAGVYVSEPCVELLLLLVRAVLKIRTRDRVIGWFRKRHLPDNFLPEFHWLKERCPAERVCALAKDMLGEESGPAIAEMLAQGPTLRRLAKLRRLTNHRLSRYRSQGALLARLTRWGREIFFLAGGVNKRYLHLPLALTRTVPTGGIVIAVVGSDGSGKSTLCRDLRKWLSWKLGVFPVYFGSGDGPSSLVRWPLLVIHRLLAGRRATSKNRAPSDASKGKARGLRRFRPLWALVLAWEKRRKLRSAWRARNRGLIVLCDRYPQNQVLGFNDGPLLSEWRTHPSRILRSLAKWEATPYEWAEEQ